MKNTAVVSFWIVCTVTLLLAWNRRPDWLNTLCLGLAASLAILTKGIAFSFLPWLVLACWWCGSRGTRLLFLRRSAAILAPIIILNLPHAIRCYELTGTPLGLPFPDGGPAMQITIKRVTLQSTAANTLRMLASHLGTRAKR